MRIALNGLFLAHPATGTGQYLRELVSAMRALSPQDEFVFIAPQYDSTAPAPVQVHRTRGTSENLAKLVFEQIIFPRATGKNFSVAHVPHFGSPLLPAHPTVVTIHDLIPVILPPYRGSPAVRIYTRLAVLAAQRADAVLADSFASARDIEAHLHIPREKIHTIHLAAHPRFQPPNASELERVRAKYNLPSKFVLYLGGFDVRKNVARVIETFRRLELGDWRLVLAGKLPEMDSAFFPDPRRMAEQAGILDKTQFIGFVDEADKPALYAVADVFLYPSHYEGFGLPPLEAMACGTPVIVANTASLPEVVGDAGILLAPDDAAGWVASLNLLLTDKARRNDLSLRGSAQAKQFSWERAARQTLAVYRAVV